MSILYRYLIAALVFSVLGMTIYVQTQKTGMVMLKARADGYEKVIAEQKSTIDAMEKIGAEHAKAIGALQMERDRIRATLSNREQAFLTLQNENIEIRNWADTALPDAIASLRRRPAISGAAAYRQRLPDSEPVQPAGERPQE